MKEKTWSERFSGEQYPALAKAVEKLYTLQDSCKAAYLAEDDFKPSPDFFAGTAEIIGEALGELEEILLGDVVVIHANKLRKLGIEAGEEVAK